MTLNLGQALKVSNPTMHKTWSVFMLTTEAEDAQVVDNMPKDDLSPSWVTGQRCQNWSNVTPSAGPS